MRPWSWFRTLAWIATWSGAAANPDELVVRLVASDAFFPSREFDASHLWLRVEGAADVPFVRFPPDGELALAGVRPGRSTLLVVWPSGDPWWRELHLVHGAPWVVELELEPHGERVVELRSKDGQALPHGAELELCWRDASGATCRRRTVVLGDGRARFPECAAREGWIEAFVEGVLLGAWHARFERGAARVELDDRALVVRLVDERGQALSGGWIELATVEPDAPWSLHCEAGADGRAELRGLSFDELLVVARHPAGGTRANLRVPLGQDGSTELEIAVAGGEELSIRLVDEGVPLPGVAVGLHASVRALFLSTRHTDAEGFARWGRMEPGAYQIHVEQGGLWPTWHTLELDGSGTPVELEIPGRGDLKLRTIDAAREPIPGVRVDLRWLARDEAVADWVADRRIVVRPSDLRTDARGELELRGLPRGRYELELTTPGGARRRERIDVHSDAARTRTLTLQ